MELMLVGTVILVRNLVLYLVSLLPVCVGELALESAGF